MGTLKYLASLEPSNSPVAQLENLSQMVDNKIEPPEAYLLLTRLRRFGLWLNGGGYLDQPYLNTLEFQAVMNAEVQHGNIKIRNAELAAEFEAKKRYGRAR